MNYYAHTADGPDGKPAGVEQWQLLKDHLRNVASLARSLAEPLDLAAEAELTGLLHDLGKYAKRFQCRLHDNSIHGINHWAAGAAHAAELRLHNSAFAVDGHHTGMPARDGDGLKQTIARMRSDTERESYCKCVESISGLLHRFAEDGLRLPHVPARSASDPFSEALRTRLLFSCVVDAEPLPV